MLLPRVMERDKVTWTAVELLTRRRYTTILWKIIDNEKSKVEELRRLIAYWVLSPHVFGVWHGSYATISIEARDSEDSSKARRQLFTRIGRLLGMIHPYSLLY
jgi:hypothetical protein